MGLEDTPTNRSIAELRVAQIRRDLAVGDFDETLESYRSAATKAGRRVDKTQWPPLLEVFDKYVDFKRPRCSPSTMRSQFAKWRQLLVRCPYPINSARDIRKWLLGETTIDYARRIMVGLNAMAKWAVKEGLIEQNPFLDFLIPASAQDVAHHESIDYWPREDRNRIIAAFRQSYKHCHHAGLVEFLFLAGCRPSEALGLTWSDITEDCCQVSFKKALVENEEGQLDLKEGLKRQKKRIVKLNNQLTNLLRSLDRGADDCFVFTSKRGGVVNWGNFTKRSWRPILKSLGLDYMKPYAFRATMITLALQGDPTADPPILPMTIADVSALVGTNPRTLNDRYAGVSKNLRLPEF
jgi:integrase